MKPSLDYPFESPPKPGESLEVAPSVRWLRMPLPMALNHINIWAILDGDGWALVDTGMRSDETLQAYRTLPTTMAGPRQLSRVIVTHMHPDHLGMAGWLTRKFNCRLWITRLEYLNCRMLMSDTGREAPEDGVQFYRQAGWNDASIEIYRARFGNFGKFIHPLPDSYRRMVDGEEIQIGAHRWRVIVGTGHSPEHACLYCPGMQLLISGDQVLPRISTNVSVYPTEPDANPMQDWLDSLSKIRRLVPDDVLVLPAHNECFRGLHARIDFLLASQQKVLERLLDRLKEPKRAIDVFAALFARSIAESDNILLHMATGESLACLNFLLERGEARRTLDSQGVAWYHSC
jgi:glyoxylase-like metal-dependent hydrolase (beta-lactamase superfamily II)